MDSGHGTHTAVSVLGDGGANGEPAAPVAQRSTFEAEILPLLGSIASRTRPRGVAIFAGLLEGERDAMERSLSSAGFAVEAARTETDTVGASWLGLLTRRQFSHASRRADS